MTTMYAATARRVLCRPSATQSLPWAAALRSKNFVAVGRPNARILQLERRSNVHVSICTKKKCCTIPIDHQHRFGVYNRIQRRHYFNASSPHDNSTATQSKNGVRNLKAVNESVAEQSNSNSTTTTGAEKGRTSNSKIWNYSTQLSSRFYTAVKESTQSSMKWLGTKITASLQSNVNQIRQRAQTSIEIITLKARQRIEGFRSRVMSGIQERTQSFLYNLTAPFQYGWNFVADLWRTTPIWNRFFWWSLSAVAVYGIATTLPKELIKIVLTQSTTPPAATPPTTTTRHSSVSTTIPKDVEDRNSVETDS